MALKVKCTKYTTGWAMLTSSALFMLTKPNVFAKQLLQVRLTNRDNILRLTKIYTYLYALLWDSNNIYNKDFTGYTLLCNFLSSLAIMSCFSKNHSNTIIALSTSRRLTKLHSSYNINNVTIDTFYPQLKSQPLSSSCTFGKLQAHVIQFS